MKMQKALKVCVAILMLASFAQAQQPGTGGLLPEGQTLLSLSVTERREVVPDRLMASLRVEREDRDERALQQQINALMEDALERVDGLDGVVVSTGRYSVYQHQRQPQGGRADIVWRGSQTVTLETASAYDEVQAMAGELQAAGFVMNRLDWQLSEAAADQVRDDMLEQAIERARSRAQRAGAALGRRDVDIAEITIGGGSPEGGPVMMRNMAMDAAGSVSPASRPGETTVSLTIEVRAVAQ